MSSIVLSFVGSQDPFAKTDTEGSIVTLVKHLRQEQAEIRLMLLLHTVDTCQNAIDTKALLEMEPFCLAVIELIEVDQALSVDPVNLLLAVQEARRGIEQALPYVLADDLLEFNSSSGTPVMKGAWSILQAAGYAPNSRVWQVRNPREMQPDQARVFQTNVETLRREFEIKVAKRQVQDYNYRGALTTLSASHLLTDMVEALLDYGYYRSARDFRRAGSCLDAVRAQIEPRWIQETALLQQKDSKARLLEAYFSAQVCLNKQQYANFLIDIFGLQESLLQFLVWDAVGLELTGERALAEQNWAQIKQVDQGRLYLHLQDYRLPRGGLLRVGESISRYVMIAILDYSPQMIEVMPLVKYLNEYCDLRNRSVHEFASVSEIQDEAKLLSALKRLMKRTVRLPDDNPFDSLNQQICELLDQILRFA